MSQHMHDMTAQDHVLTVLPLFHVGGLNIQTTPALQLGATVTLHAALRAGGDAGRHRARPADAYRAGAGHHPGLIEHPRWADDQARQPARSDHGLHAGAAAAGRCFYRARRAGAAGVRLDGDLPVAVYTRLAGDWRRPGSTGLAGARLRGKVVDDQGSEVAAGTAGEVVVRGPNVFTEYWGNAAATAEALREGWYHSGDIGDARCRRAFLHPRPQEERDHLRRREHLSSRGGARARPAPGHRRRRRDRPADDKWQEVPVAYMVASARADTRAWPRSSAFAWPSWRATRCRGSTCSWREPAAQCHGQGAAFPAQGADRQSGSGGGSAPGDGAEAHEDRRPGRWQWLVRGGR